MSKKSNVVKYEIFIDGDWMSATPTGEKTTFPIYTLDLNHQEFVAKNGHHFWVPESHIRIKK